VKSVCANCHASDWINNFYLQFDGVVDLGNEKFFKPAKELMTKLQQAGKITNTPFDAPIKWTYYELWHHQGRRARMGASMNGPDYVQWHGFYEIARIFYAGFLPEAEHLMPGVTASIKESSYNQWMKGLSPEQRQKIREFYRQRHEQPPE